MGDTVETIQLVITATDKEAQKALADLTRNAQKVSVSADKTSKSFLGLDKSVIKAAAGFASLGAVISLGKQFAQLQLESERALTKVATLADFTTEELDGMRQGTIELQRQFGISFGEISEARFDVVSSGFADVTEQQQILTGAFTLGAANATSMSVATQTLTSVMSAFGRGADETNRTMDELTAIAQGSKTNLEGLASAIAKVAPTAVSAGIALAEVGGALDVMTLAGISADESSTAISAALRTLVTPATRDAIESAGVQLRDLDTKAALPLAEQLRNLSRLAPDQLKTLIPSEEAQRAFSVLLNNLDSFEQKASFIASEDAIGGTARSAAKAMDTLDFKLNVLSETFNSLFQEGTFFGEQMKVSIEGLTAEVLFLRDLVGDTATEQENAANMTTAAQQRVLDLQKEIGQVTGQIDAVQRNLDATFASSGEIREKQLDFQAEKQSLLIGLTRQLEEAEKSLGKERERTAMEEAFVGPSIELATIPPPPAPDPVQTTKEFDAIEKLITRAKLKGVNDRVRLVNNEFDQIIAAAEKQNAREEQITAVNVERARVLSQVRIEIAEKGAQEAEKIRREEDRDRREIEREEQRRAKERAALFESIATQEREAFLATASERERIILEETEKEAAIQEEARAARAEGLISESELTDILAESNERLNKALAFRGVSEDAAENFAALVEQAKAANEEFSTLGFLIDEIGEKSEVMEAFGEIAAIAFQAATAAAEALGSALVDQAIAGDFSAKALGKAAQQAAAQVLKAEAAEAAGKAIIQVAEGLAALALAALGFPNAAQAAGLHFAAAAQYAAVAGAATGLAKAVGGGGGGGGSLGGGGGEDVISAERRRRRRDLDEERAGGGPTLVTNVRLVGTASRSEIDNLADLNTDILRRQFDNQSVGINSQTISGQ